MPLTEQQAEAVGRKVQDRSTSLATVALEVAEQRLGKAKFTGEERAAFNTGVAAGFTGTMAALGSMGLLRDPEDPAWEVVLHA